MNAIELLQHQHREVAPLLWRTRDAEGDEKIQLVGPIVEALTLNSVLEEQYFYPFIRSQVPRRTYVLWLHDLAHLKSLVSELLRAKQTGSGIDLTLTQLRGAMDRHMNGQEATLFPGVLEELEDPRSLDELSRDMQRAMDKLQRQELLEMAEHSFAPGAP